MNERSTIDVLNRLIAAHSRSLAHYLSFAVPHFSARDVQAAQTLRLVARDQQTMVDRLAHLVQEQAGAVNLGHYPMKFTGWHDLDLSFLAKQLVDDQRQRVQITTDCVQQLRLAPFARAVAEEALGMAKGHLESLQELAAGQAA